MDTRNTKGNWEFYKSHRRAHSAASPFPKKVTLRLCRSLVNALATLRLASNLFRGREGQIYPPKTPKHLFHVALTNRKDRLLPTFFV